MRKLRKTIGVLAVLILCVTLSAVLSQMDFWGEEEEQDSSVRLEELGIQAHFNDQNESEPSWWGFDKNTKEFLDHSLTNAIGTKYDVIFNSDSMSRCTTYVDYRLKMNKDDVTPMVADGFYYGEAILYKGCGGPSDEEILFRLSTNDAFNNAFIEVQNKNGDYGSIEQWLAE